MTIIAFCGLKGSGKTTAAEHIVRKYPYTRMSFAGPLKEAAMTMFDLSPQQVYEMPFKEEIDERWGITPREILQRLGTEVGREFDKDLWIKNLKSRAEKSETSIVIDDCRFFNESEAIKSMGGHVIGIKRADLKASNHASELEMDENWSRMVDCTIWNLTDMQSFITKVDFAIQSILLKI